MIFSETIKEIAPALVSFNSEISKIEKDSENPYLKSKYASLDQIIESIRPVLSSNKLFVAQSPTTNDGFVTVKTLVLHESGEWIESNGTTIKPPKNDPQGIGAGITYARRYDLSATLSLNVGEDDDGESLKGNDDQNQENPITQKQVGELKKKALQFAKARKQTLEAVYQVLKITDITQLNENQASTIIKQLDAWLDGVKKEKEVKQ